jgi:hypothetical protein
VWPKAKVAGVKVLVFDTVAVHSSVKFVGASDVLRAEISEIRVDDVAMPVARLTPDMEVSVAVDTLPSVGMELWLVGKTRRGQPVVE